MHDAQRKRGRRRSSSSRGRWGFLKGGVLTGLIITGLVLMPVPAAEAAGPGSWSQSQVNTAIADGVAYLDSQQNTNGSYGGGSVAETGMALVAYGVLANGSFSSLSSSYQAHVKSAINFILSQQNTTAAPGTNSSFGEITNIGYPTYETGIALLGLSYFKTVNPGVPTAIADAREFLINEFEGPANDGCSSADVSPTASWCGGWNYDPGDDRSDESNSGYAMTGLEVTGGIPASIVPDNINWNHHVQEITGNPFAARDDGGADYQPGGSYCGFNHVGDHCSNTNDSGTMLFSYADDGVAAGDPHVVAGIKFDEDALNSYEDGKAVGERTMIFHHGNTEDGSCTPSVGVCDWYNGSDGGYHYSMFSLTKGLGSYVAPVLSSPTNWYAQVVDLLLSQQATDGSWPPDGRDDYDTVFATGLSVAALGKVAVVSTACTMTSTTKTTAFNTGTQSIHVENAVSTDLTATQHLVLRSLSGPSQFFSLSSLTSAKCDDNPNYPTGEDGPDNTFSGNGTGSFGASYYSNAPGYSIHFEIGDWGDTTGADDTADDTVNFTVKNSDGTVVWSGKGKLTSGSEEISG